ncbi:J domain-containing protein [Acaryochloris sp. CCMEE 5410]|uniref:J domain-containing protein n=1 Tax=Acaryochloris sp. CCMEE 5410 TaxID=310037 RepID=UPI0002484E71|nr:J domain-containing protein [Acaryochloris sp. CCMEE 5410]KAI9130388.1 J domain-containing protein [Acaryochloris sp. CCMEE 5410]
MDIADCYRLLQLTSRANIEDLKASYRRLARQWHPDTNPGDQLAHEKFIQVTEAYKTLQKIVPPAPNNSTVPASVPSRATAKPRSAPSVKVSTQPAKPSSPPPPQQPQHQTRPQASISRPRVTVPKQPTPQPKPSSAPRKSPLSPADIKLKVDSYKQLQELIQRQRFPRAVALIEALAQRLPQDVEVRQWQAIIYQSWGRQLIRERKLNQARAYLKKALNTDPHNKALWAEIELDFKKIEMAF